MSLNVKLEFWFLLVLCIAALVLPIIIRDRLSGGLFIDSESYKSLSVANQIKNNGDISNDRLSYGGKPFAEEKLWYYILSIKSDFLARFLPLILGIFSFVLFYLLIGKIAPNLKLLSSILLIISPAFLYLFSTATKYSAALFFILLGFYLMSINKKIFAYASFFISGLFSIISLFFIVLVFLFYSLKKEKAKEFYILFFGSIFIFLLQFYNLLKLGFPQLIFGFTSFSFTSFFSFVIFGVGGRYGFGFFMLFLALIGIYRYHSDRFKFLLYYIILFLALITAFYFRFFMSYFVFVLAFFAAFGLSTFFKGELKSDLFKFLTLLVIACGLLFSLIVFYEGVSRFEPTKGYFEGISFLKSRLGADTVLTDYRRGSYITYAGKKTFIDNNFLYAPALNIRIKDEDVLYSGININSTLELLKADRINYIIVDNRMKNELFRNHEEGLLFLLAYSPNTFFKLFNNSEVTIWYRPEI